MDKAVEELQQELKLLKNEIKETLPDVREVLLNTVENPFPQESATSLVTHAPPPPVVAPPVPEAPPPPQPAAAPPVAPPPAPAPQMPQMPPGPMGGYPMGGAPIVLGSMGVGGATPSGASAAEMQAMQATIQAMQANMANTADSASPAEMQAMQVEMQAMQAKMASMADSAADAAATPPMKTSPPATGPGLPPRSRSGAAGPAEKPPPGGRRSGGPGLPPRGGASPNRKPRGAERPAEEDEEQQRSAKASARPSRYGSADAGGRRRKTRGRRHDDDERYVDDADDVDGGYDDDYGEDEDDRDPRRWTKGDGDQDDWGEPQQSGRAKGKVDLIVLASLAPWLSEGVYQLGRKRVKSLLEVYASMGGIPAEMKDVLLQIVSLDDTEGPEKPVAIHDTMRFLIELDDLMWRGRQDWRHVALMSMIGSSKLSFGKETE